MKSKKSLGDTLSTPYSVTYDLNGPQQLFRGRSSIIEVTVLGGGDQGLCDDCTKALRDKKPDDEGGQKL